MSDNPSEHKHRSRFWIGCLAAVGFAVGIWAALFKPAVGPLIKPLIAGLLIVSGLVLVSPFATSRPSNALQRAARRRISVLGAAFVLVGVAQVLPSFGVRITLLGFGLLLLAGAATGFPKRLFAPAS